MPRRFKVVSKNRINNCWPSYATKTLHLASWPNRPRTVQNQSTTNPYKRAIVNDRKGKSSRIHVPCNDLVLCRLRSKQLSPVCTGTAFPFVECNQSENQFKENLNTSNLVPRVSHLTAPWGKLAPGGGKMRDPGNEVGIRQAARKKPKQRAKIT